MVKVHGPLFSLTARGWLGGDMYGHYDYKHGVFHTPKWLVRSPYPFALLGRLRLWDRVTSLGTVLKYWVPAFGLRPYPPFISQYYSPIGWCYQRRRTWHGTVWSVIRPPISENKKSSYQIVCQSKFAAAVACWQGMNQETKNIYHAWTYPEKASGYNRFLRWYMRFGPTPIVGANYILLEDGGKIETEAGEFLIQET